MKKFYAEIEQKLEKFLKSHSSDELAEIFAELYNKHSEGLTVEEYLERTENIYSEIYNNLELDKENFYVSEMHINTGSQEEIEFVKKSPDFTVKFTENITLTDKAIKVETKNNFYTPDNKEFNIAA